MRMIYLFAAILMLTINVSGETLFEIKDATGQTVLLVADDGLCVLNQGDTMMVISTTEAKINLDSSKDKALSRSFSVSTNSSGKAGIANVLEVTTDNTIMREGTGGDEYTNFSPENIFIGLNAGGSTTGNSNVFIGNSAGIANTSGSYNTFVGTDAGISNSDRYSNTFVGHEAGANANSDCNTFMGYRSGYGNTSGMYNSFYGQYSGNNIDKGHGNCAFGMNAAMYVNDGNENTVMGYEAGHGSTSYAYNYNCLFGAHSGFGLSSGSENVMMGYMSGYNNNGTGNIFIGYKSGYNEYGSNKLYIDNSTTATPLIYGDFGTNAVTINGTLTTTGNTSVGGTLTTGSNATVNGDAVINGDAHIINSTNAVGQTGLIIDTDGEATDIPLRIRTDTAASGWTDADTKFIVQGDGNTGIGTSAPGSHKLAVSGNATAVAGVTGYFENTSTAEGISLHAKNTSSTNSALAFLAATAGTGDIVRFDSWHGTGTWDAEFRFDNNGDGYCDNAWHAGGTDYAEYFPKANIGMTYEKGDIIMLSPDKTYTVEGANDSNRKLILGVFSDNPAVVGNSPAEEISHDNDILVGLLGVLKTKVSTENGDIEIGDFITVSSTPTVGAKAINSGMVVGRAMDNYSGSGIGIINVFVNVEDHINTSEINDLKKELEELKSMMKAQNK